MFKQLKAIATMGAMTAALMASSPTLADNQIFERIWSAPMMSMMDKNKDGVVTRQEYMDYMGAQFDKMDAKKTGKLTKSEFMDKKMMQSTFPVEHKITAGG